MGDHATARDAHQLAITGAESTGLTQDRVMALHGLARATAALGERARALGQATEALGVYETIGLAGTAELRRLVDDLSGSIAE